MVIGKYISIYGGDIKRDVMKKVIEDSTGFQKIKANS